MFQLSVEREPGKTEKREHAEAGDPDAQERLRPFRFGEVKARCELSDDGKPRYGSGPWDVVDAAAIVSLVSDGIVGDIRTRSIESACRQQLRIQMTPASMCMVGQQDECDEQDQFFREIGGVEVVAVGGFVDMHGLPWNHG